MLHAIEIPKKGMWVQLRCFTHKKKSVSKQYDDSIDTLANAEKYKFEHTMNKHDLGAFWVPMSEVKKIFSSAYVAHYEANWQKKLVSFHQGKSRMFGIDVEIESDSSQLYIQVDQLDKLYSHKNFTYSDVRLYLIKKEFKAEFCINQSQLIGSTHSLSQKSTFIEAKLKKGEYIIICDTQNHEHYTDFAVSLYYPEESSLEITEMDQKKSLVAYRDSLSNSTIHHGTEELITSDGSIIKYTMVSMRLGQIIWVFKNSGDVKMDIDIKIDLKGSKKNVDYECDEVDNNGAQKLSVPEKSFRTIIMKYNNSKKWKPEMISSNCSKSVESKPVRRKTNK